MYKMIIIMLLAVISVKSFAGSQHNIVKSEPDLINSCEIFTKEQQKVLQYSYEKGKEHNLQWTLAAIAWQESSAGQKLKNKNSDSYGLYGNMLSTVNSRLKDEEFKKNLPKIPLTQKQTVMLIQHDWEFAATFALVELEYWKNRHSGDRGKMISSYFGGNKFNSKSAKYYRSCIDEKIRELKKSGCINV